jgi:hypothetical protein
VQGSYVHQIVGVGDRYTMTATVSWPAREWLEVRERHDRFKSGTTYLDDRNSLVQMLYLEIFQILSRGR